MTGSGQWQLALTAERDGGAPRRLEVTAPPGTTAGEVIDALAEHLGLAGAAGAVCAESVLSGVWVRRDLAVADSGLLRGEHLRLSVGLQSPGPEAVLRRWDGPSPAPDNAGRVALNRPPRSARVAPLTDIALPAAPDVPAKQRFPIGTVLIPLGVALVLVAVTRRPETALFALLSPIMLLWSRYDDRRAGRSTFRRDLRVYGERVESAVAEANADADRWLHRLHDAHPGPAYAATLAPALSPRLWERRPDDPDFLEIRVGAGRLRAPVTVRVADSDAAGATRHRIEQALVRDGAPVVVSLPRSGVISVLGDGTDLDDLLRWIVCQICTLHSPRDVRLTGVLAGHLSAEWPFWSPHVAGPTPDDSAVVFGTTAAHRVISAVAAQVTERGAARPGQPGTEARPVIVVLVDARTGLDPASYTRILEQGPAVGVQTIWFGSDERLVPGASAAVLTVSRGRASAVLSLVRPGEQIALLPEGLDGATLNATARALAPLTDASDTGRGGTLPERVLLDELDPDLDSPAARRRAWETAPAGSLMATIGVRAGGAFDIDLGTGGHHVLIGGTTGAGKSELLQTMVTSLAARYSPERVAFLLVDYKGGTAFKDGVHLPHTVGLVTDLDGHLTRRVLVALNAEIRHRLELLRQGNARSLAELEQSGPTAAPPVLIIIVDEFATLAKDIPEFVAGVVDVAARGRALGLRLVLATQRPAGVVNAQIRGNVGLSIALRVNDDSDSNDVLDSPAAAAIPAALPGRAIARVGSELVEFQSAYVAAPPSGGRGTRVGVRDLGRPAARGADTPQGSGPTLLEAVVDATTKVMQLGHWRRPVPPWLPPLNHTVTVAELAEDAKAGLPGTAVLLGRTDEPDQQRQRVLALDFDRHQNLLVYGTTRSGKTTLLRTVAAGVVTRWSPEQAYFYVLDFGGHGLQSLARSAHCGGVIAGDDAGRVARLLRHLRREIDDRKRLMLANGVTGYPDIAGNGRMPAPPRVVVLLDAYGAFTAAFERIDGGRLVDLLHRLVADGPSAGIHFVITVDRRAAVPGILSSVVTTRLVLRMGDRDDYTLLGVDAALARGATLPAGRGFVQGAIEVQVAVVSPDTSAQGQVQHLDAVFRPALAGSPLRAPTVGSMPADVPRMTLPPPTTALRIPAGLGDDRLEPWSLDLTHGHALIAGPSRSGRSTALATIAAGLARAPVPALLVLVAPRRSPLLALDGWAAVLPDPPDGAAVDKILASFESELAGGRPVVVICDDVDDLGEPVAKALEGLARRGRDVPLRCVVAADNRTALRTYSGVLPQVRKSKHGVLLAPDVDIDGELFGVRLRSPIEVMQVPGRGFGVGNGTAELVQVAR